MQGRFSRDHPVNCSPQVSTWDQLSSLAAIQHANLTQQPRATTVAYSAVTQGGDKLALEGFRPSPYRSLAPSGDRLAIAGAIAPTICSSLANRVTELQPGHVTEFSNGLGTWSASGKYAFVRCGSLKPEAGVQEEDCAFSVYCFNPESAQGFQVPYCYWDMPPYLAWSACSQLLAISDIFDVRVLNVSTGAVTKIRTLCNTASAWHPRRRALLCLNKAAVLKVFSFESEHPRCTARLDLRPVFGPLKAWSHTTPTHCMLSVTPDGSRAVVGLASYSEAWQPTRAALVQIDQPCAVLGQWDIAPPHGVADVCFGINTCAVHQAGTVYIFSLEESSIGHLLWTLSGAAVAYSPCGTCIAVIRASRRHVEVLRLSTKQSVSSWAPDQIFSDLGSHWRIRKNGHHSLSWQHNGQLHLQSELRIDYEDCVWFCCGLSF